MARINIIVATTENGVIGNNNDLPWYLPTDLKSFKSITENHIVVMGRKCWESIPDKFRPLTNRLNIVLSREVGYKAKGALVYNNINSVINDYRLNDKDIFIIGGGQIYKESFGLADTLYLTEIKGDVKGDTFLKGYNKDDWKLIDKSNIVSENGFEFTFNKYKSKVKKSIAIIGSKSFNDYNLLKSAMMPYIDKCDNMISGYSKGADKLGEKWADEYGIKKLIFKPDYEKHKESAEIIRNKTIIDNSDLIFCFWDGLSKGTKYSIDLAQELGKDILIVRF
tara:strand:- start:3089 stop:3928 length:840 start_codon:yes stop_codon:yes gene_type:complete